MSDRTAQTDIEGFRSEFRGFLEVAVEPYQAEWREKNCVSRDVWERAAEAGLLGITIDPRWGGRGLGFLHALVLSEELSRVHEMGWGLLLHNEIVLPYIEAIGTETQKERYLRECVAGRCITAFAMTEPTGGSDVAALRTTATRSGDGSWVLRGDKTYIANGQLCDLALVVAVTDPEAPRAEWGLSLFLVDAATPGFERGPNLNTLGMRGQDTSDIHFRDCRLPADALLGREGRAFQYVMERLPRERLVVSAGAQARAEVVLTKTIERVKERRVFGRALSDFQHTAFVLADCATDVTVGRALLDKAVSAFVQGDDVTVLTAMSKMWHTDMLARVAASCAQLWGGAGWLCDNGVGRAVADAAMQKVYAGTNEVMRMIVARDLGLTGG